jgi:hypothetical protein
VADFLQDLVTERENAATTIAKVHRAFGDRNATTTAADARYMDLVATANGFLKSVAFGIEIDQFNVDRWKADAALVVAKAKDFETSVIALRQAQDEDAIGPSRGASAGPPGAKPSTTLFSFDGVSSGITDFFKGIQQIKQSGQTFGDSQRHALADSIRTDSLWYDLDSVLKSGGPPAPDRHPATAAAPRPVAQPSP